MTTRMAESRMGKKVALYSNVIPS